MKGIACLTSIVFCACGSTNNPREPEPDTRPPDEDRYVLRCDSLFAARIVEMAREKAPQAPLDCEAPLTAAVGELAPGMPLCHGGESANQCRVRLYSSPPSLDTLPRGCTGGNCLRAMWLPACSDGTDTCAEPDVVCQDGTRPMIYVAPATAGPSNKWIVFDTGAGGPCRDEQCWLSYRYADLVGDAIFEQTMSSLHPDYHATSARVGSGIMNGEPGSRLAAFNRVELKRCADSASNGETDEPVGDGVPAKLAAAYPPGTPVATASSRVRVWHHGYPIHKALVHALSAGGNGIPGMRDATHVVFTGSSDSAGHLTMVADQLAKDVRTIAKPSTDVRIILDGKYAPGLDAEGRFSAGAPASFDLFTQPYHLTQRCGPLPDNGDGVANERCSDAMWRPGPLPDGGATFADLHGGRKGFLDASCVAAHGETAPCLNDFHVLANHVALPILIVADQEDPLVSRRAQMAEIQSYTWPDIAAYRERVLAQAGDFQRVWGSREDASGGLVMMLRKERRAGQPASRAIHTHLDDTDRVHRLQMTKCDAQGTALDRLTIADLIDRWVSGTLADPFMIEQPGAPGAAVWVTGSTCRAPE